MRGTLILLAIAVALLLGTGTKCMAQGNTVTLGWNPSPSAGVTGYYIYYGTTTNINNMTPIPVGSTATNITIGGLVNGQTYYFTAESHDASYNTSSPSPEVSLVAGAVAQVAGMLRAVTGLSGGHFGFTLSGATGAKYVVQASTDLIHWVALQTNTAPFQFVDSNAAGFSHRFYRTFYLSN